MAITFSGAGNPVSVDGTDRGFYITRMTPVSASGSAVDFTGIPTWVQRITIIYDSLSTASIQTPTIRLGYSSTVENTGYTSGVTNMANTIATQASATSGFEIITTMAAANSLSGQCILTNVTGNTWIASGWSYQGSSTQQMYNGRKALSSTLTRVQLTTTAGTDTFDAGTISVMYE